MTCQKQPIVTFVTEYTMAMERRSTFTKCLHKKVPINKCAMTLQPWKSFSILATMMGNTQICTQYIYVQTHTQILSHTYTHTKNWPPTLKYMLERVRFIMTPHFSILQTSWKTVLCMMCRGCTWQLNVFFEMHRMYSIVHSNFSPRLVLSWWVYSTWNQADAHKHTHTHTSFVCMQVEDAVLLNQGEPVRTCEFCYVWLNQLKPITKDPLKTSHEEALLFVSKDRALTKFTHWAPVLKAHRSEDMCLGMLISVCNCISWNDTSRDKFFGVTTNRLICEYIKPYRYTETYSFSRSLLQNGSNLPAEPRSDNQLMIVVSMMLLTAIKHNQI